MATATKRSAHCRRLTPAGGQNIFETTGDRRMYADTAPPPLIWTSLFASHCHSQAMAGFPVMRPRRPAAPPDRYRDVFDDPAGDHGWRRVHRMMIGSVSCLCCLMQRQRCPRATASLLPPRCFVRFVTESRAFVVGCNLQASEVSGRFGAREKQGDQIGQCSRDRILSFVLY
jgi:hypothetical protein